MQETRHNAGALRYLVAGPAGLLEFRLTPNIAALIRHTPTCDGDQCHCDADNGDDIAIAYRLGEDAAVWAELDRHALAAEIYMIPQPAHEPTAAECSFAAALRAEGQRMVNEGHFHNGQEN